MESPDNLGVSLCELPKATLSSIGLGYGLAVMQIRNLQEFSKALSQPNEGRVGLLVRRGKTDLYVPMEIGALRAPDMLKGPRPSTETFLRT